MFFGVGAYGVSLPRYAGGTNWSALVIGSSPRRRCRWRWLWRPGLFSLWMQSIFFFMATSAVT